MGIAVALEFVIEVGVRVKMNDGQVAELASKSTHNRIRNGVIAAQGDWPLALIEECAHGSFDLREGVALGYG